MSPAMDADSAAEPICLFIDRPIALIASMGLYPRRRQHRAAHTQIFNSSSKLLNGRFRFLQWNQSHAFKTRAPLHVSLMQPVIVCARDIDGPVAADDFAESEA